MQEQKLKLVIITPAFNPSKEEIELFATSLKQIQSELNKHYDLSFVVVDDGSKQVLDLPICCEEQILLIIHDANKGKGEAIKTGIKSGQNADIIVYTDFDFPYILVNLYNMVTLLVEENGDIVLAKRSVEYFAKLPFQRKMISKLLLFFNKNIMGLQHFDTQGGLKVLKAKHAGLLLNTRSTGFLFEIEFIHSAQKASLKIMDCEVQLRADVRIPTLSWKSIFKNIRALFAILIKRKKV